VRSDRFRLQSELALELERRFPARFVRRYAMVMFHPEIEYAEARRLGAIQQRILERLTEGIDELRAVDFEAARALIEGEL
jgi:kynurenine 3-monooxygenase